MRRGSRAAVTFLETRPGMPRAAALASINIWATIFRKRSTLDAAFHRFDPRAVATMTDEDVGRVLADPGTIRNRRKIEAIVHDARMMCTGPSLAELAWSHQPPDRRPLGNWTEGLRWSEEARAFSAHLSGVGYRGVGPTVSHAFLTTIGVLNGHVEGCFRTSSTQSTGWPPSPPGR